MPYKKSKISGIVTIPPRKMSRCFGFAVDQEAAPRMPLEYGR